MKNVLFQARLLCVEIITANTLKKEYDKRLHHAQTITDSFKERFNKGDVNVIEFNKAQLLLLNAINESEINENNRKAFLAELAALNGGIPIALDDTMFVSSVLPSDFEQWYIETEKNSPVLSWLRQEIEISQKNQKLNFALSLPRFSAGYMSEKVVGQQFQGLSVGISIPLFENKNSVKHAKANVLAMQAMEKDYQITFYNKLKALHNRAIGLQKTLEKFRNAIQTIDNSEYLKTALDKGEISLIEYLMEISLYYTSVINMIETEKELQKTIAELAMFQ
jgi:outer membrane protein TolC